MIENWKQLGKVDGRIVSQKNWLHNLHLTVTTNRLSLVRRMGHCWGATRASRQASKLEEGGHWLATHVNHSNFDWSGRTSLQPTSRKLGWTSAKAAKILNSAPPVNVVDRFAGEYHVSKRHRSSPRTQPAMRVLSPLYAPARQGNAVHLQKNVRKEIVRISWRFRCRRIMCSRFNRARAGLKVQSFKNSNQLLRSPLRKLKTKTDPQGFAKFKSQFYGK